MWDFLGLLHNMPGHKNDKYGLEEMTFADTIQTAIKTDIMVWRRLSAQFTFVTLESENAVWETGSFLFAFRASHHGFFRLVI